MTRHWLGIVLTMSLAGCTTKPLATATVTAPITGSVTIGGGTKTEFVPVVKTILKPCAPPPALLQKHAPLPLIAQKKLTLPQAVNLWIDDEGLYDSLNVDHSELIDWLNANCR